MCIYIHICVYYLCLYLSHTLTLLLLLLLHSTGLDGGRLSIGACSLGAAQQCFELALKYVKERKQFGKPVGDNQALQFKLEAR